MKKNNQPITKEDLGLMLHKYINPVYEDVQSLKKDMGRLDNKVTSLQNKMEKDMSSLRRQVDKVERIQLRMENKLLYDNKMLHDRDDAHDKKLKDHEKRLTSIEEGF